MLEALHDVVTLVGQFGPYCGSLILAIAWFFYKDAKREQSLNARISALETETRDTLIPLVKDCTAVITRNTEVMERLEKTLEHHRK